MKIQTLIDEAAILVLAVGVVVLAASIFGCSAPVAPTPAPVASPVTPAEPEPSAPASIRCATSSGVVYTCDATHAVTDGINGITSPAGACARWAWTKPYAGGCASRAPCEVVSAKGEYIEGVCL